MSTGLAYKRKGDYKSALQYYLKAERICKDYPELYNSLGKVYFILENFNEAMKSYCLAAHYSSKLIDLNILNIKAKGLDEIMKQNQVKGQINGVMLNFLEL